jgi:hypothetical protein
MQISTAIVWHKLVEAMLREPFGAPPQEAYSYQKRNKVLFKHSGKDIPCDDASENVNRANYTYSSNDGELSKSVVSWRRWQDPITVSAMAKTSKVSLSAYFFSSAQCSSSSTGCSIAAP